VTGSEKENSKQNTFNRVTHRYQHAVPLDTGTCPSCCCPDLRPLTLVLYGRSVPVLLYNMVNAVCLQFVASKHLMDCRTCVRDSWTTIAWIIALGCLQAVTLVYSVVKCCVHSHNEQHQLGTAFTSAAEPMLGVQQDEVIE
jgi:hypothetical protein